MTNKDHFDLIVIGSGPAGEKAATQAAFFGRRPVIVERDRTGVGGAALHNAGIPTKTLREAALYISGFGHRDLYGVGLRMPHAQAPVQAVQGRRRHPRGDLTFLLPDVQRLLEQSGLSVEVHRLDGASGLPDELRIVIATREIAPES